MKKILMVLLFVFMSTDSNADIVFQDNFESDPADWECIDGQLSNWSIGYIDCASTVGFGPEWKMGAGHNSNNAVYAWKKDTVPNGYRSESQKWLYGEDIKSEIYHRWYMKWPTVLDKNIAEGFKLWRYITRENGYSNPPVVYLNIRDSPLSSGDLVIYNVETGYLTLGPVSDFNDGEWHCLELRIKLNSNGASDGIIQYWLDGNVESTHNSLSFSSVVSDLKIHRFGVGIGNVSDSPWFMTEWTAASFDDIVVATEYIGPIAQTYDSPTITAPADFSTTESSVEIEGTYTTDPALTVSTVTWTLGENSGLCVAALGVFSCVVPVELGANSIVFTVTDSNAGMDSDTTVVTRTSETQSSISSTSVSHGVIFK